MSTAIRPGFSVGAYGLSVFAALSFHAAIFWIFFGGLDALLPKPQKALQVNKVINASLVVVKPKEVKKPAKKKAIKKKAVKKVETKKVEAKNIETKKAAPKPAPIKPKPEKQAPKADQRKPDTIKQPLAEPANRSLSEELLAEEDQALEYEQEQSELAYYSQSMTRLIEQNWSRPPSARNGMQVLLTIGLLPTGDVISVRIKQGSGNVAFDRSAIAAVKKIGRFDELQSMTPKLFNRYFREIDLAFKPEDLRL